MLRRIHNALYRDHREHQRQQRQHDEAELFASDYFAIDDAHFADLQRHFSTPQIVELNLFAALMLAGGRMTYVQRGYEEPDAADSTMV